jgi:hypothetical protein
MKFSSSLLLAAIAIASTNADDIAQQQQQQSSAASNSTDCSYACSDVYEPVCGSDGVTYSNECALNLADCESPSQIAQVADGECSTTGSASQASSYGASSSTDGTDTPICNDACPAIFSPVCGSNGETYESDCFLEIAQCVSGGAVTKVSDGQCPGASASSSGSGGAACAEVCIEIYKPVCGSDGVTYSNSCFLGIATCKDPSITQVSDGVCVAGEGSYDTNITSVGSSGESSVDGESSSTSSSSSGCPSICYTLYAPVCGSDGVTYGNDCELEVASCQQPQAAPHQGGRRRVLVRLQDECLSRRLDVRSGFPLILTLSKNRVHVEELLVCTHVEVSDSKTTGDSKHQREGLVVPVRTRRRAFPRNQATGCVPFAVVLRRESLPNAAAACWTVSHSPSYHEAPHQVLPKMKLSLCLVLGAAAMASTQTLSPPLNCPSMCTDVYQPVCGSGGVTYSNTCHLSLAACNDSSREITQVHDGECSSTECNDACPAIFKPVCGSNGETYSSDCLLEVAQCVSGGAVTKVSDGECPGSTDTSEAGSGGPICSEVCIEILKPVCGSDRVTYPNSCFLGITTCKDPSITQASEGACPTSEGSYGTNTSTDSSEEASETSSKPSEPSCPDVCIAMYAPVCGSDGVTYSNSCKLSVASCEHPELHITQASDGACVTAC